METILKRTDNLRVVALILMIGALPFLCNPQEESVASRYLDDYSQHVGFTYGANATLNTAYLWRGIYAGSMNIQGGGCAGYGGLYADVWVNLGTDTWAFSKFQPEVDFTFGFARWGLDVNVLFVHSFMCPFFDFGYHPGGGNAIELRAAYTVSSKLPLSFLWSTRVGGSDAYIGTAGDTLRAYSTYVELSYMHPLPYDISVGGCIGVTPWRSLYTGYQGRFAVQNVEVRARKIWGLTEHCGLKLQGTLSINPHLLADDLSSAQWHPLNPGGQSVNANIALGVFLK